MKLTSAIRKLLRRLLTTRPNVPRRANVPRPATQERFVEKIYPKPPEIDPDPEMLLPAPQFGRCKWPYGHSKAPPGWQFCGRRAELATNDKWLYGTFRPYCKAHFALSIKPSKLSELSPPPE